MHPERTPQEMILELYDLFSSFKKRIEDPNYIQIENTLEKLVENQNEMKNEIKELKKQLLNPFNGVIVENKKNSDFREEEEERKDEREKLIEEHKHLMRWKRNVVKIGVGLISSITAIITVLITKYLNK